MLLPAVWLVTPLIPRLLMKFCFCPGTNCTQQSQCIPGFEANTFENYTFRVYCFRLYEFLEVLIAWIGRMITFSLIRRMKTIPSTKMRDTRHVHSSCFHVAKETGVSNGRLGRGLAAKPISPSIDTHQRLRQPARMNINRITQAS